MVPWGTVGFQHEAYDMVQAKIAIVDQASGTGCAIVHSDDAIGIQHLNQEAATLSAEQEPATYFKSKSNELDNKHPQKRAHTSNRF